MIDKMVAWNNRCWYTEHGQRLAAVWDGTNIHYVDIDRMISGSVKCGNVDSEHTLKERAMAAYDNGLGDRSMDDLELRDKLEAFAKEHAPSLKAEHDILVGPRA